MKHFKFKMLWSIQRHVALLMSVTMLGVLVCVLRNSMRCMCVCALVLEFVRARAHA